MTYDSRTESFVVPAESMRLAEDLLKAAIRQQRQMAAGSTDEAIKERTYMAESHILKALEYIGLYCGQNKPHELDVRER